MSSFKQVTNIRTKSELVASGMTEDEASVASKVEITGVGNYVHVYKATGVLRVELVRDNESFETHYLGQGVTLNDRDFEAVWVYAEEDQTDIKVFTGKGNYGTAGNSETTNVVLDEGQLNVAVNKIDIADSVNELGEITISAGQVVQVLAANVNRLKATVSAGAANIYNLKIGNTDNVVTTGTPLGVAPSQAIDKSKLGVWLYNGSNEDQAVVVTEYLTSGA